MEITAGQKNVQNTIKAAVASAKAATSMEPVKLIAQDGSEIIIDRRAAMVSGTIKSMLAGPGMRLSSPCRLACSITASFPRIGTKLCRL